MCVHVCAESICDYGAGRMKEFRDSLATVDLNKNGQRYLREERERRMNRVQKRNSRKRLGDDGACVSDSCVCVCVCTKA